MSITNILLILISGLGVLHGLLLAIFLWTHPKNNNKSNKFLSLLLLVLTFRIGKSVFLEFIEDLDIQFIFIGLATLMAIGPLFLFYTKSLINESFTFEVKYFIHFIPAFLGVLFGFWIGNNLVDSMPKIIFILLFLGYYGHYLAYLFIAYRLISKEKDARLNHNSYPLLKLLFFALLALWVVYFLNLFDEFIPYIIGPILYTFLAYTISFIVFKKGYIKTSSHTKYKTTPASDEQIDLIYSKILKLVEGGEEYKNSNLTLNSLSKKLHITNQTLSMVINKKSKANFNSFINHYRIEEAIRMFKNKHSENKTIAAIAYEAGFNSISSFNSAFKKHTKTTPRAFRNKLGK